MAYNDLKVEHNGQEIHFAEYKDVWRCEALDMEDASLAKLKKKMADYDLQLRKIKPLAALKISYHGYSDVSPAKVTSIADDSHVWATIKGRYEKARSKVQIAMLAHDTPQVRDRIIQAKKIGKEGEKLIAEANAIMEAIPRITIEELRDNAELRQQAEAEKDDA